MIDAEILIVGAGPVGQTLAILLKKHNIPFLIIDSATTWSDKSKAMTITSRTLEHLNVIGVADNMVANGIPVRFLNYYFANHKVACADFSTLNSKYNFVLQIPQSKTTKILNQTLTELDCKVQFSKMLIGFEIKSNLVHCELQDVNSQKRILIKSRFLVACDGSQSTIRKIDGVNFSGGEDNETFLMADIPIDYLPLEFEQRHLFYLKKRSFFYIMPIEYRENKKIYRIITTKKSGQNYSNTDIIKLFSNLFNQIKVYDFRLGDPLWISSFNPRQFLVDNFHNNQILYAGDAAHIQSPIGSQGLNTGIQDAFNLSWRLAFIIKGKLNRSALSDYSAERRPVAEALFSLNNKISKTVFKDNIFKRLFKIAPKLLLKYPKFNQKEIELISQFGISYGDNGEIRRLPNLLTINDKSVYDLLSPVRFNLILFDPQLLSHCQPILENVNIILVKPSVYSAPYIAYIVRPDTYISMLIKTKQALFEAIRALEGPVGA